MIRFLCAAPIEGGSKLWLQRSANVERDARGSITKLKSLVNEAYEIFVKCKGSTCRVQGH